MVLGNEVVYFLLLILLIIGFNKSKAAVYKVGDSAGWTNVGHVDYKTWSSAKNFNVGDTIAFEYNKQFHNVVRVTHKNFKECNAAGAYESFISGNDSFVIKHTGHFYFICSVPGHCESGQKVDVRVPDEKPAGTPSQSPTPTPTPIPTPLTTPPPPSVPHPPKAPPPSSTHPTKSHPSPSPLTHPPSPQPAPPTASTPAPTWSPTPPSYQPAASPPVNYDAPAPSPTSGSSYIYSSTKGLFLFTALSVFYGIGW